ncbi:MAG: FG-GAP-like repeat-containing protein [Sandaracinaceae bacterium]|nr:FG-GAP-like repeat-containing protein [Sandaracinaceae bacterium]
MHGGPLPRDDCDDADATTYLGAPELCDRLDNDCSSGGGPEPAEDLDADGHAATTAACSGGPLPRDDCADSDPTTFPGNAGIPALAWPENGATTGSYRGAAAGTLRPRFRWRAPTGGCAPTYEIQIDDSCTTPGFAACAFASPEYTSAGIASTEHRPSGDLAVATAAPVGRRYYWRVRACEASVCSAWSAPRYADVGRVACDFNGDGLSDSVVGTPTETVGSTTEAGRIRMFSATGTGFAAPVIRNDPSPGTNGHFGEGVACAGDLNADGFGDLIVARGGSSRAHLYAGSSTGLPTTPTMSLPDRRGDVAAAGDVNADGYADLLVADQPVVRVHHGDATLVSATAATTLDGSGLGSSADYGLAAASAGDVNGDGYADVIVGAPRVDAPETDEGNAYLHYGGPSGIAATPGVTLDHPGDQAGALFASSVSSAGDVDGDSYVDVIVGARSHDVGASTNEGSAYLFRGGASGLEPTPAVALDPPGDVPSAFFGSAVTWLDANADGFSDVAVASPGSDQVFVYGGSASGLSATPSTVLMGGGRNYAADLAGARDVDGDGYGDLAVGHANYSVSPTGTITYAGRVYVHRGSSAGLATTPFATLSASVAALFGDYIASGEDGERPHRWAVRVAPAILPRREERV